MLMLYRRTTTVFFATHLIKGNNNVNGRLSLLTKDTRFIDCSEVVHLFTTFSSERNGWAWCCASLLAAGLLALFFNEPPALFSVVDLTSCFRYTWLLLQWIPISSLHNDIYLEAADGTTVLYIHALWLLKAWNSAVPCYISSHLYPHRSPVHRHVLLRLFLLHVRNASPRKQMIYPLDLLSIRWILVLWSTSYLGSLPTSTKNLMVPIESSLVHFSIQFYLYLYTKVDYIFCLSRIYSAETRCLLRVLSFSRSCTINQSNIILTSQDSLCENSNSSTPWMIEETQQLVHALCQIVYFSCHVYTSSWIKMCTSYRHRQQCPWYSLQRERTSETCYSLHSTFHVHVRWHNLKQWVQASSCNSSESGKWTLPMM